MEAVPHTVGSVSPSAGFHHPCEFVRWALLMQKESSEGEQQASLQDLPYFLLDNQLQHLLRVDTRLTARLCCSSKLLQQHLTSVLSSCPDLRRLVVAQRNAVVHTALSQAKTQALRSDSTLLTSLWLAACGLSCASVDFQGHWTRYPASLLPLLVLTYTVTVLAQRRSRSYSKMLGLLLDFSLSYASNISITTQVGTFNCQIF